MKIIQIPSPNFGSRNSKIPSCVVIHIMAGSLIAADNWFKDKNSGVSAHYGIGLNGEIHQYVDEKDASWAQGRVSNPTAKLILLNPGINPNQYSIAIEHEGQDLAKWTDEQLKTSADLVKDICIRYNIPVDADHIIFHKEIYDQKPFCPTQDPNFKTRFLALLETDPLVPLMIPQSKVARISEIIKLL